MYLNFASIVLTLVYQKTSMLLIGYLKNLYYLSLSQSLVCLSLGMHPGCFYFLEKEK